MSGIMQQKQLKKLNRITDADFHFVPANKNQFGVKYYEHACANDEEFQRIAGDLNQRQNVFYTCLEYPGGNISIAVVQNELDKNRIENIMWGRVPDLADTKPIGKIHGNDVYLELITTQSGKASGVVMRHGRAIAVVVINGHRLPFYVSSGLAGKEAEYGIASGKWYPLQGISDSGWLNKMPDMNKNPYPELDQVCAMLEKKYPAAILKQRALNNELPAADRDALLKTANSEFVEGTPYNERSLYQYYRNHIIYLPAVIDAWRTAPKDFLEITGGALQIHELNTLEKIRKTDLMANSTLEDNIVWLTPVPSQLATQTGAETTQGIQRQLDKLGLGGAFFYSDNNDGIGLPVETFDNYFYANQVQNLVAATKRINAQPRKQGKQDSVIQIALDKVKKMFNG